MKSKSVQEKSEMYLKYHMERSTWYFCDSTNTS